jgi:UDP-N-acetylglucosamine 4-epimerase
VQANLLAATASTQAINQVYNIAVGGSTSLNQLFFILRDNLSRNFPRLKDAQPHYREFRCGDVRHSLAEIVKAMKLMGYKPTHTIEDGLLEAMNWYLSDFEKALKSSRNA